MPADDDEANRLPCRLLAVISECARRVDEDELLTQEDIAEMRQAADELRRRGDTLVWARDIRALAQATDRLDLNEADQAAVEAARLRIEDALAACSRRPLPASASSGSRVHRHRPGSARFR
jgi:hypothetical protein